MEQRRFPNLFLIGAMKSGTTTLHEMLGCHPEIFMSPYKEPGFFSGQWFPHDAWFDDHPGPDPEGHWYHALFEEARRNPSTKYAGESSANYTRRPVWDRCAERIRAFNPEARILYIMRDPVERSISHYKHNTYFELERRSMVEAARSDRSLTDVSYYAMQLRPYLDAFPPKQIHVLTLESFADDRERAFRAIFEWLGVDPSYQVPDLGRLNVSPRHPYQVRPGMTWLARITRTRFWRKRTRGSKGLHKIAHRLAFHRIPDDQHQLDRARFIDYLRPILAEHTRALSQLLGREFPEWPTTFSSQAAPRHWNNNSNAEPASAPLPT